MFTLLVYLFYNCTLNDCSSNATLMKIIDYERTPTGKVKKGTMRSTEFILEQKQLTSPLWLPEDLEHQDARIYI